MIETSLTTIFGLPEASVSRLVPPTSLPTIGKSGIPIGHEVEGSLGHADHQIWEIRQEVFEKGLFMEELDKLRVMCYDDLEKKAILSLQ